MLTSIHIRNLALIDDLEISFDEGLTVLTGETGAGKSVIVGALNLVLGDRATSDILRQKCEQAEIEALFHLEHGGPTQQVLNDLGIHAEDGMLVVRRIVTRKGKNKVYLNGRLATLSELRQVVSPLVDMTSQHAHTSLLKVPKHREVLDCFNENQDALQNYINAYHNWCEAKAAFVNLQSADENRSEREDLLRFQLGEIEAVNPQPGEDESLAAENQILSHAKELREAATQTEHLLYARSGAASEVLATVERDLRDAGAKDATLALLADRVDAARIELEDVAMEARLYCSRVDIDPRRLEQTQERLSNLRRLLRKHGPSIEDVIAKKIAIETELTTFDDLDGQLHALQKKVSEARATLDQSATTLTRARQQAARKVEGSVERELSDLSMHNARFKVALSATSEPTEHGMDSVEFLLSSNIGEDPAPLAKIASGGELSRVMLALKHVMATADTVDLYVFDEVDSGVSGGVAERIGAKLRTTAQHRQVLCITHLPQVACHAQNHIHVEKNVHEGRTITRVRALDHTERLEEIARLLAGVEVTDHARAHAHELMKSATRH